MGTEPRSGGDKFSGRSARPGIDGASSTHRSLTSETQARGVEAGIDTWRLAFKADASGVGRRVFELDEGYRGQWFPEHGLLAVEGHPAGRGVLAKPSELGRAFERVEELVGPFGATFRGVARADLTAGVRFSSSQAGRAYFAGMSAIELPRCETTRRGTPVHSVWWTGAKSREIKGRTYDKGLERGSAQPFELVRLEDQRRFRSGARPTLEELTDAGWCRDTMTARFARLREAVVGVTVASLPVIGKALADEARYGYRSWAEAERLAGSLVLLAGGAGEAYSRATYFRRRAELRAAGYVLADGWMEPVSVELADVLELAMSADTWREHHAPPSERVG